MRLRMNLSAPAIASGGGIGTHALLTLGGVNWNTGSSADMGVARDRTECIDWS